MEEEIKEITSIINKELKNGLKHEESYQSIIFESINYSIFTGGKRLRPILLI